MPMLPDALGCELKRMERGASASDSPGNKQVCHKGGFAEAAAVQQGAVRGQDKRDQAYQRRSCPEVAE